MSLRDRLICFADFVGMTLLAHLFLLTACLPYASSLPPTAPFRLRLPSPNSFLRVCPATLFTPVWKFFLPLTTSAISRTANSNKSAPMRFAAGTIYLRKIRIAVHPITCASAPNPRPRCRPTPL